MRHGILTVVLAGSVAAPAWAQRVTDRYLDRNEGGRYSADAQGIPSGYLPPPGTCRVWHDGRPAGHQPPATACEDAERTARRDRTARVIYGGDRRAPEATRNVPYEQGFKDGREEGRADRRDDKRFDPTRHSRYQAADHGLERRDGGTGGDRDAYREGFRAGYAEGYSLKMTRAER